MATVPRIRVAPEVDYPSSDGKPMAETPIHRQNLTDLIAMLQLWYAQNLLVYVSGNMFIYYVRGNKYKHVSPDVFLVHGVPRDKERDYYLVWEEKSPDLAIELTSRSTKKEDLEDKFQLYRDVLKVKEYFLFDPYAEYLTPPLRGYRLRNGRYAQIKPVAGRCPARSSACTWSGTAGSCGCTFPPPVNGCRLRKSGPTEPRRPCDRRRPRSTGCNAS